MQPTRGMDTAALARSILDTHHALLHRELPRLAVAFRASPTQLRAPFMRLKQVMDEHMMKEERILFPMIIALAEGGPNAGCGVDGPIAQMGAEHNGIRMLEDELRGVASLAGPEEESLMALLDDLSEHARTEDEALFPAALALSREAALRPPSPTRDDDDDDEPEPAPRPVLVSITTPPAPAPPAPAPPRRRHVEAPARAPAAHAGRTIRETRGACPTCHADVPAAVIVRDGAALLEKRCPTHGPSTQLLSRHPDLWTELDRFYFSVNDEAYPQRDFIVRMTEKCNLACPICLAKANTEDTPDLDLSGLETLLSERRGIKIDLMAAEPTLRPDLEDWVRRVKASGNIAALHTNGIKLADLAYARRLAEAGVDEVFLQFDGLDDAANTVLRGRPLLKARLAALANLRTLGIATSLIVVIAGGLNEAQVGETFRFALQPDNAHIREVFFLGLRSMGSARQSADPETGTLAGQTLMPDALIDELCAQVPEIRRRDVHDFNMVYFAMLSAFRVKKCLYVQHYLVARDGLGGFTPISDVVDLRKMANAAQRYASRRKAHPTLARAGFGAAVIRQGLRPAALKMGGDLLRLEKLFATGMNLGQVPTRFLLIGFITACDLDNFDSGVSVNCGKGELSADGGFAESSAVANVAREARFSETARTPGPAWRAPARERP
ncbi:MAG: hemerythrin domain-containing protein [Pseudomonadota bacterium]|nr:hemerythrin domain-containing protein [Pseudomonadota bacterium]